MAFHFTYLPSDDLPRLSWCCRISFRDARVEVRHGPWVETRGEFFFEGAWTGSFQNADFAETDCCMGSGARNEGKRILFAPPSHTLERLFTIRRDGLLYVSNSLPFILAASGESLRGDYPFYHLDFMSMIDGVGHHVRTTPLGSGRLRQHYFDGFEVDTRGAVKLLPRARPPVFPSYGRYREYLTRSIRSIVSNGLDPARRRALVPLATVSTGYDSAAVAVLLREAGCEEAVTFTEARETYATRSDSGKVIAERLGMVVSEFRRDAYRSREGCPEAEFLAPGMDGQDVVMLALEEKLPGRLLFTGFHGDKVWGFGEKVSSSIRRTDASGASLSEFRLRVGFGHVPAPMIGCARHPSIDAITRSEEMKDFFVNGAAGKKPSYERPIPRRLLEEAGIPRQWFGQSKKAVTQPLTFVPRHRIFSYLPLRDSMTEESWNDFSRYLREHPIPARRIPSMRFELMRALHGLNGRVASLSRRALRRLGIRKSVPQVVHWRYEHPLREHAFVVHWAVQKTMDRYLRALDRPGADRARS